MTPPLHDTCSVDSQYNQNMCSFLRVEARKQEFFLPSHENFALLSVVEVIVVEKLQGKKVVELQK
jgi:hypothetical protein